MRTVLITGASRGIGRAIALYFARQDPEVVVIGTYKSDQKAADSLKHELEDRGVRCALCRCDIADAQQVVDLFRWVGQEFGRLDVLVNNAGITADGSFAQAEDQEVERIVQTNLEGAVRCSWAAYDLLTASSGAVVMVSSIAAVKGKEGQALYSATKGALMGLTRLLARNWGPRGVRVNAVAPGFIRTDMVAELDPAMYGHVLQGTTLRRIGEPDEVASVVWFLAGPGASYINGSVLAIDGGLQK